MHVDSSPHVATLPRRLRRDTPTRQHARPSLPSEAPQTTPGAPRLRRLVDWCLRARQLPVRRLERGDWLYLSGAFLLSRAAILVLGVLGAAMFPEVGPGQTWSLQPITGLTPDLWMRLYVHFDSGWYLGISHAYQTAASGNPQWLNEWEFFPFYPMVLHPVSLLLRAVHAPGNVDGLAAVLVSHAALFGGLVYLYRLVTAEINVDAARRTVIYLVIFPASLFLSAAYPEGLFLFLSVGSFYHARRHQWFLAGALAALATVTRIQGICLLAPLALEFAAAWRADQTSRRGRTVLRASWLGLPLVALGCYAAYSHAVTGYWLAFLAAGKFWGHTPTPPLYPLVRYIIAPTLGGAFSFDFTSANFVTAVGFLLLAVVAARRLPPAYAIWLAIGILLPLSSSGHELFGMMRYAAPLFPGFVAMAMWSLGLRWTPSGLQRDQGHTSARSEVCDRIITVPSLLLLSLMVVMFVNGVWAAV